MHKLTAAVAIVTMLGVGQGAAAREHLVDRAAVDAALSESARRAEADRECLDRALGGPEAQRAAQGMGWDIARVRTAAAALSDAEVRELAARAAELDSDPVAGAGDRDLLTLVLIVLIVVLLLKAL
jgi:hypothetical protein